MVQMQYFGDDRDYFKHDLIAWILERKASSLHNLIYIPMLTEHRVNQEGNRHHKDTFGRSGDLLNFIKGCTPKSLEHWQRWYTPRVANYQTVEPIDNIFFKHETRLEYWKQFKHLIPTKNALVFVDPDTGLETRTKGYMRRMGFDKYILNQELLGLVNLLDSSSVLMIYQHLPNDNRAHVQQVEKRLLQITATCGQVYPIAYRENDLAFLFIAKTEEMIGKMRVFLQAYHDKSKHKTKTLV